MLCFCYGPRLEPCAILGHLCMTMLIRISNPNVIYLRILNLPAGRLVRKSYKEPKKAGSLTRFFHMTINMILIFSFPVFWPFCL